MVCKLQHAVMKFSLHCERAHFCRLKVACDEAPTPAQLAELVEKLGDAIDAALAS